MRLRDITIQQTNDFTYLMMRRISSAADTVGIWMKHGHVKTSAKTLRYDLMHHCCCLFSDV